MKKWGKEQGERGSLPLDPRSPVCTDLRGCAFWYLVGLPLISCDAVQKRAHRLGAHTAGGILLWEGTTVWGYPSFTMDRLHTPVRS